MPKTPTAGSGRVALRQLSPDDAPFILELLNDPDFIANIADRNVRSLDDAKGYLNKGPIEMYERLGFGLWCVELSATSTPIGICGLLKREWLDDVDIGFAFLPGFRGKGYAREAAELTMARARDVHGLSRVVAIVSPANERSKRLLRSIGFRMERTVRADEKSPELELFAWP